VNNLSPFLENMGLELSQNEYEDLAESLPVDGRLYKPKYFPFGTP
jgi:hypothetical protein